MTLTIRARIARSLRSLADRIEQGQRIGALNDCKRGGAPLDLRLSQTKAALLLGVTREHLNRVLKGHRASKTLSRRYRDLLRSHANGAA